MEINQSILSEISLEYSLEGLMLNLALQIVWPPDVKSQLIGKDPGAEKDWGTGEKGQQRMRSLDGIIDSMDLSLEKLWVIVKYREALPAAVHEITISQT